MHMHNEENMNQIIRAEFMHDNFDHKKLESIAEMILDPQNVNIMLRAKCLETDQTAKWYGTKYKIEDISDDLKEIILHPNIQFKNKKLDLPTANTLLPSEIEAVSDEVDEIPSLILSSKEKDVWLMRSNTP